MQQCAYNMSQVILLTSFVFDTTHSSSFNDKFNSWRRYHASGLYRLCILAHVTYSTFTSDWFTFSISPNTDAPRSEIQFLLRLEDEKQVTHQRSFVVSISFDAPCTIRYLIPTCDKWKCRIFKSYIL